MSWVEEKSDREQLKRVSDANLIEEGGHSVLVRRSIIFIVIMLAIFVIWSIFTKVEEVSVSFGEVQPVKDVQVIQHLEGGVVSKVFVKDSQEVKVGETLMLMNPSAVNAELQKAQGRVVSLNLDAERLRAFIHKTPDKKIDWLERIKGSAYSKYSANQAKVAELIKQDMRFLEQQNKDRESQRKILTEQVAQRKSQIAQLKTGKIELGKQLVLYEKEEKMFQTLAPRGYISQRDYLIAQRKTHESRAQIKQTTSKLVEARSSLIEAQSQLEKLDSSLNKEALKELNDIDAQLLEMRHTIQRLQDASKRMTIKSPIVGIVKGLKVLTGSVLAPGEVVMEIVPTEGEMQILCRISTHDVGHVKVGDPAQIKIMAFDYARYGGIDGQVESISASTFMNKEGLPYYKAFVSVERNYVGKDPSRFHLKPGMTAQVDIITGKKSIMAYLMKPITRALDNAFRER